MWGRMRPEPREPVFAHAVQYHVHALGLGFPDLGHPVGGLVVNGLVHALGAEKIVLRLAGRADHMSAVHQPG